MPKPSNNSAIMLHINPDSIASEAYRSLRFNIEFSMPHPGVKTITVTSANRGEGKTTTAINLAVAYAQTGKNVILLDADLRKPSIHQMLGGDNSRGLVNFLRKQNSISDIIRDSYIENLSLIMSGPILPNPTELLGSNLMDMLLTELKSNYDMIIIDTSIITLTDAKVMAAKSDGVILVVEHGKVKRAVAKKIKEELMLTKTKLLGVVMNKIRSQDAEAYF